MKKVWILEKFEDADTMRKHLDDYKSMASHEGLPAEQAATLDNLVAAQEAILAEYPQRSLVRLRRQDYLSSVLRLCQSCYPS